jgi:hypothetical protein
MRAARKLGRVFGVHPASISVAWAKARSAAAEERLDCATSYNRRAGL